jgi:hypothetical protein
MTLAFWASDAVLASVQATTVALPRATDAFAPLAARLRSRWWALVPLASVVVVVFAIRAATGTASLLTWLALVAVPPLAALALGLAIHGARPRLALGAILLFALAWADRRGLAGEGAALLLSALSCVALGVLLTSVAPLQWLKAGIVLMALADTTLVVAQLLQPANDLLNAAHPPAGLPQLQRGLFGDAVMGYGDLFIAAVLGTIVANQYDRRGQKSFALLTLALATAFDLLFLVVDLLPATVPVALALLLGDRLQTRMFGQERNSGTATVSKGSRTETTWKPPHSSTQESPESRGAHRS